MCVACAFRKAHRRGGYSAPLARGIVTLLCPYSAYCSWYIIRHTSRFNLIVLSHSRQHIFLKTVPRFHNCLVLTVTTSIMTNSCNWRVFHTPCVIGLSGSINVTFNYNTNIRCTSDYSLARYIRYKLFLSNFTKTFTQIRGKTISSRSLSIKI